MKPALFAHKTEDYYTLICRSLQERVYFLKISHESGRFVDCKASELSSVNYIFGALIPVLDCVPDVEDLLDHGNDMTRGRV